MSRNLLLAFLGLAAISNAQTFEVASVKADKSENGGGIGMNFHGDRFSARNLPLLIIISIALDVPFQGEGNRLSGGPEWIRRERFDIEAAAGKGAFPPGTPFTARKEKMRLMLQTLLAERFKMTIRRESKDLPVYALVVGKSGPKLQKSSIQDKDCSDDTACHQIMGGRGRGLHGKAIDISDVVRFFGNWSDRPILDKTGITGLYDIETEGWAPSIPTNPDGGEVSEEAKAMADPNRPTIFAIFDRLGLKLEAQKAPVEIYVIEHIERPTAN